MRKRNKSTETDNRIRHSTLKIPYLSDQCSARIKRQKSRRKTQTTHTCCNYSWSEIKENPHTPKCPNKDYITCKAMKGNGKCTDQNVIYHMNCEMETCIPRSRGHNYGETLRETHDRYSEHYRQAKNPTAKSYSDKPWAKHYQTHHPNCEDPKIGIEIVGHASSTNERKVREAWIILKNNSDLNDKNEQSDIRRFLV